MSSNKNSSIFFFRFFLIKNFILNSSSNFLLQNSSIFFSDFFFFKKKKLNFFFLDTLDFYKTSKSSLVKLEKDVYAKEVSLALFDPLKNYFLSHSKLFSSIFFLYFNWFKYKNFFSDFFHFKSDVDFSYSAKLSNYSNFFTFLQWTLSSRYFTSFLNKFFIYKHIYSIFNSKKILSYKFFDFFFFKIRGLKYYKARSNFSFLILNNFYKKKSINIGYLKLYTIMNKKKQTIKTKTSNVLDFFFKPFFFKPFFFFFLNIRRNGLGVINFKLYQKNSLLKQWSFFFKKKSKLNSFFFNQKIKIKKLKKNLFIIKNKLQFQIKFEKEQNKEDKFKIKKLNTQIERLSFQLSRSIIPTFIFKKVKKPFFFILKFNFLFLSKLVYLTKIYMSSFSFPSFLYRKIVYINYIFVYFENIMNKFFSFFLLWYSFYTFIGCLFSFFLYKHSFKLKKIKFSFFLFSFFKKFSFYRLFYFRIKQLFSFSYILKLSTYNFIWSNYIFFFNKKKYTFLKYFYKQHFLFLKRLKLGTLKFNKFNSFSLNSVFNSSNKSFFYYKDFVKDSFYKSYFLFCTYISFNDVLNYRFKHSIFFTHYNFIKLVGLFTKNGFKIRSENIFIKLFISLKYIFKKDSFLILNRCISKLESGFGIQKFRKSKFSFYFKFIPLFVHKNKSSSLHFIYRGIKFYNKSHLKCLLEKILNEIFEFYIENKKSFSRKLMLNNFLTLVRSKKEKSTFILKKNYFFNIHSCNRFIRSFEFKPNFLNSIPSKNLNSFIFNSFSSFLPYYKHLKLNNFPLYALNKDRLFFQAFQIFFLKL